MLVLSNSHGLSIIDVYHVFLTELQSKHLFRQFFGNGMSHKTNWYMVSVLVLTKVYNVFEILFVTLNM